jgi:hypothetical protein
MWFRAPDGVPEELDALEEPAPIAGLTKDHEQRLGRARGKGGRTTFPGVLEERRQADAVVVPQL